MNNKSVLRYKEALKRQGMTQKSLARKTGISSETLSRYFGNSKESDSKIENPSYDKIKKIATKLGITPEYLLGWSNIRSRETTYRLELMYELIKLDRIAYKIKDGEIREQWYANLEKIFDRVKKVREKDNVITDKTCELLKQTFNYNSDGLKEIVINLEYVKETWKDFGPEYEEMLKEDAEMSVRFKENEEEYGTEIFTKAKINEMKAQIKQKEAEITALKEKINAGKKYWEAIEGKERNRISTKQ